MLSRRFSIWLSVLGQQSQWWFPMLLCPITMSVLSFPAAWITRTNEPMSSIIWHYELLGLLVGALSRILVWWRPSQPERMMRTILWTSVTSWGVVLVSNSLFLVLSGVPVQQLEQQLNLSGPTLATLFATLSGMLSAGLWLVYEHDQARQSLSPAQKRLSRKACILLIVICLLLLGMASIPPMIL